MISDFDLSILIEPLQNWYRKNARILPWRSDPVPYHVWISEIMLQQTRVEAVKPYYKRFTEALPDVYALAGCSEDVYLKLWEGLGYYSRVRNLNAAAAQIVQDYGGEIPSEVSELLKLKGIGSYTAGAIASLAYNRPEPAVDGNVLRVLTRVTGDDTDIMKQSFRTQTEKILRDLMRVYSRTDGQRILIPRIFNQALMELGALVCLPNGQPHCCKCPWKEVCRAKAENRIAGIPVKKKIKERRIEEKTVFIIQDDRTVAIHKRPAKGLLAGLYELPNQPEFMSEEDTLSYVKSIGFNPLHIEPLSDAKHIFSHVEWHMKGYLIRVEEAAFSTEEQKEKAAKERLIFVDADDAQGKYAIPSAFAAYAGFLQKLPSVL